MIYRARLLVTMDGPPVEDGAVLVRGGSIAAVGRWVDVRREFAGEDATDLGEVVLLPGFINPHCHLDYSTLRHAILPPRSFAEWVGRINALKRTLAPEDYLAAIARGFRESARWGTTSLLNIESFPELMWKMPPPPLRTWWFYEMIDVRSATATEELVAGALLFFQETAQDPTVGEWPGGRGLSPHAPYTASPELYRLVRECALAHGLPWTTHLGESRDEQEMFVHGRGPLHDFLAKLGRPMDDCGAGRSALAQLTARGCLGPECIAVHLNDWEESDFALVAPGGSLAGLTVVHCPLSHRYFQHTAFPLERLQKLAVNLCVGTDSPASDGSFSLLEELRALAAAHPALDPAEMLDLITCNPARALHLEGKLGCVKPGAWADLTAFSIPSANLCNIHAEVVGCHAPAAWMMAHGRVVSGDATV